MPSLPPELWMFAVVIIFNAGGVFYLSRNSNAKLDRLGDRLGSVEQRLSYLEGARSMPHRLTEN